MAGIMHLSVPGNLLLAGEYMVTEEGGLGITAAIERRIRVTAEPAAGKTGFEVTGIRHRERIRWSLNTRDSSPLFSAIVKTVTASLPGADFPPLALTVDTTQLFSRDGTKRGYGSSAAVCVGLTAALLAALQGGIPEPEEVFPPALAAHREFQGGRGSGYDVAASLYGGTGLFCGGKTPQFRRVGLPISALVLLSGVKPVATSGAIHRYSRWKEDNPAEWRTLFRESNQLVEGFSRARTPEEIRTLFLRARDLGIHLGDRIGVDARFTPLHDADRELLFPGPAKSLGAGNEVAAVPAFGKESSGTRVAEEGLLWERCALEAVPWRE